MVGSNNSEVGIGEHTGSGVIGEAQATVHVLPALLGCTVGILTVGIGHVERAPQLGAVGVGEQQALGSGIKVVDAQCLGRAGKTGHLCGEAVVALGDNNFARAAEQVCVILVLYVNVGCELPFSVKFCYRSHLCCCGHSHAEQGSEQCEKVMFLHTFKTND